MTTTLNIQNLKCHGCANTIRKRLSELDDVTEVTVNNEHHSVTFDHSQDTTITDVSRLLSQLGYPIIGENNSFGKKAKSFVSCAIGRID
ncbi:MAG: cation transporter [Flavobacteriaceae bacterium]|nr:cation transporter [Flavobacteriaceae bacterium]